MKYYASISAGGTGQMPSLVRGSDAREGGVAHFGDPVLQRPQADPQHLGGAFAIATHVLKGEFDVRLLEFHERLAGLEDDRSVTSVRSAGIRTWA
jgi:hypothetical protein